MTARLKQTGYVIINIDGIVIAEEPRVSSYIDGMRENIANITGLAFGAVSIKATTTEKMGFTGRGEGIAASAICLIDGVAPTEQNV